MRNGTSIDAVLRESAPSSERSFRRGSLGVKVLATVAVSSLGSVLLAALFLGSYYSLTAKRQAHIELGRQADILAREVSRALSDQDGPPQRSAATRRIPLRALLAYGRLDYVGLWSRETRGDEPREAVAAGGPPPSFRALEAALKSSELGGQAAAERSVPVDYRGASGAMLGAARVVPGSDGRLVVVVARRSGIADGRVLARLGAAALLGLAVAVGLGGWLARRVMAPLRQLESAAVAVASGDYDARVEVPSDEELARVANAINSMAAAVGDARRRERRLLTTISHDLRTPLTSIRAYGEAIADGTLQGEDELRKAGEVVAGEARRLARLVDVLFDVARLGSGELSVRAVEVDLDDLLEDVASVFSARAEKQGIELSVSAESDCVVVTDPDRLAQALCNLLDNALEATPSGGKVELGARYLGEAVEVWVRDTGPGLSREALPYVFEPGVTSRGDIRDTAGRRSVHGFGLPIVKQIAELLGARLSVESEPGRGTRFAMVLSILPGPLLAKKGRKLDAQRSRPSRALSEGAESTTPEGAVS